MNVTRTAAKSGSAAARVLAREGVAPARVRQVRALDLRYVGQSFELTIRLPSGPLTAARLAGLEAAFFRSHARAYGFAARGEPIEVVNVRLTAIGVVPRPRRRRVAAGGRAGRAALKGVRAVVFGRGAAERVRHCPVYDHFSRPPVPVKNAIYSRSLARVTVTSWVDSVTLALEQGSLLR